MISANINNNILQWYNTKPYNIHQRRNICWLNNMRASNRGKVKKKCQCFIYNSTTVYDSNKNYLQKLKLHGFILWFSQYYAKTANKNLWNNYCIMRGLKVKLNLALKFFPQWLCFLVKWHFNYHFTNPCTLVKQQR